MYLDDILISCQRRGRLRRAVRDCKTRLRKAGFIVGEKSETTPTECLGFIGKTLDTRDGFQSVRIGSDSNVARTQINSLRACVSAGPRQRILRRLFWLRCWSGCSISSFRVRSAINPADPLSRVVSFQSRAQAVADAEARRVMWDKQTDGKYEGLAVLSVECETQRLMSWCRV